MKVTLARSGGMAAGLRVGRAAPQLDTETLSDDEVSKLGQLINAAELAPKTPPTPARDALSYTVTVERDGKKTILTGSDAAMAPEFAELLSWIEPLLPEY